MGKYCTAALAAGTKLAKLYAATLGRLNDVQAFEVDFNGNEFSAITDLDW